jgi:hypothetical protein
MHFTAGQGTIDYGRIGNVIIFIRPVMTVSLKRFSGGKNAVRSGKLSIRH